MISSVLIPSVFDPAGLRLLCTIGCGIGTAAVLYGLRFDRRSSSKEFHSSSPDPEPTVQSPFAESDSPQQTIRLSTEPGPTRSSDMSQQQKIAAALARAGIAGTAGWRDPEPSGQSAVGVEVLPDPRSATTRIVNPPTDSKTANSSRQLRRLILSAGSILILVSLFVFLTLR